MVTSDQPKYKFPRPIRILNGRFVYIGTIERTRDGLSLYASLTPVINLDNYRAMRGGYIVRSQTVEIRTYSVSIENDDLYSAWAMWVKEVSRGNSITYRLD